MTKQLNLVNDLGDEAIASLKVLVVRSPHTSLDSLQTGYRVNYQCVATKADYLAHLNQDIDLILADYRSQLPAVEALRLLQETLLNIPLIVINGSPRVAVAVEHMKAGATDYLIDPNDLTKAVEQALTSHPQQQTQNKLQTLITENADGIIVVDRHRRVQFVNAAALKLLGRQAEELLNQPFGFPVVGSDYLEVDLPSATGEIRVAQMRVTEIFWQGSAYLVSLRDITELKRAEAERIQLLEQAQAANRAKDEFLAVLSHELRTPLNPILGWTQLLQNRQLDQAQTEKALDIIERNANLQVQLIDDLLDISRIIQGRLKLQNSPVNLKTAIANALETVQLAAQAKSIHIHLDLATVGLVQGDLTRLQQVIWNLLSNAIKFTPSGGRVDVRLAAIGTNAQIQISDTGQGIAPHFLPYVFDYFRQADSATTRSFGGLGLGLAIVRQLVELHGGSVKADSPGEGQGATFTVTLPMLASQGETNAREPAAIAQPNLTGVRVLVVDDEADTRDLLVFVLEPVGMVVKTAASAAEALKLIELFRPQLLISDIGMPGMDGYELIRAIRALPPQQSGIPALSLSAFSSDSDRQRSLEAGFDEHLTKPTDLERLVSIIAQIIGG